MTQRRVGRLECEALAEIVGRRRPVSGFELSTTANVVRLRALEQLVERAHQRIDRARFDRALPRELRFGSWKVAPCSIGHAELIVCGRRPRIECERLLEMRHRSGIVFFRKRHTTGAEVGRC